MGTCMVWSSPPFRWEWERELEGVVGRLRTQACWPGWWRAGQGGAGNVGKEWTEVRGGGYLKDFVVFGVWKWERSAGRDG